jgi:16S rRNA (cytosine1402-N4)-methyltransferase
MLEQTREHLALRPGETFVDCTLGGAGHALALAPALQPGGYLVGIDQDAVALTVARDRLHKALPQLRLTLLSGNFAELDTLLSELSIIGIDAALLDLGVSSPQLDTPQRGFSYAREAPLDMRMAPGKQSKTAAEILNTANAADLTWILRSYGEERWASRIAAAIVAHRQRSPLATTTELAELVRTAIPAAARRQGGNPAKRTFQALRIAVNDEMEALKSGLDAVIRWLNPGGRVVVISYHSLEDRIVKESFASLKRGCICPPEQPICTCGRKPVFSAVSGKALRPADDEKQCNGRSASARLRWAVKSKAVEDDAALRC